jgi:hypothetical protein
VSNQESTCPDLMGKTPHAKMGKLPNGFARPHVIVYR